MFSAIMNFTLAGAIGMVGLLTLRRVSEPREVLLALLPLLFALHQFTQGFVWLGMQQLITARGLHIAESIFVFYAQGLLTFLVPMAVWLIEPSGPRRTFIVGQVQISGDIQRKSHQTGIVARIGQASPIDSINDILDLYLASPLIAKLYRKVEFTRYVLVPAWR